MRDIGVSARKSSHQLAYATTEQKNNFREVHARSLEDNKKSILKYNLLDLEKANKRNFDEAFIDRRTLSNSSIRSMCDGLLQVKCLEDLIGKVMNRQKRPSGIDVCPTRVTIGFIGMIYDSRPNLPL